MKESNAKKFKLEGNEIKVLLEWYIIPFLKASYGSAFARDENGNFAEEKL